MSFVQSNGIVERSGLRSRKALALFVVLVVSGGAFLFGSEEAHAQRPTPKVHAAVAGAERAPVSELGLVEPATETLPADSTRVDERDAGSRYGAESDPVASNTPALELLEELYPAAWLDPLPGTAMLEGLGATFGPDPTHDPASALLAPGFPLGAWYPAPFVDSLPAPGPAGFGPALPYPGLTPAPVWDPTVPEAYKPLSWRVEEKPPVLSPAGIPEGVWPTFRHWNTAAGAVPVGPLAPFADREAPPTGLVLQGPPMPTSVVAVPSREASLLPSSVEAAANSPVETLYGASEDVSETLVPGGEAPVETPSGATTKSSGDAPPLPTPAPLGGSYFSPSIGGQVGPGGVVPVLICVLVVGLILLRPFVGRLSWASCELPKPSSVLILPLERPG